MSTPRRKPVPQVILEVLYNLEVKMDLMQDRIEEIRRRMNELTPESPDVSDDVNDAVDDADDSSDFDDFEDTDDQMYLMIIIANALVKKHDAIIFGGYVRDMIANGVNLDKYECDFDSATAIAPHSIDFTINGRGRISYDFVRGMLEDCMDECAKDFLEDFQSMSVVPTAKEENDDNSNIHTTEMRIIVKRSDGSSITVPVKYMCQNEPHTMPPFGRIDLECDAFVWDRAGVRISRNTGLKWIDNASIMNIRDIESRIIQDIQHKTTVAHGDYLDHGTTFAKRIHNLVINGWSIYLASRKGFLKQCETCQCNYCASVLLGGTMVFKQDTSTYTACMSCFIEHERVQKVKS